MNKSDLELNVYNPSGTSLAGATTNASQSELPLLQPTSKQPISMLKWIYWEMTTHFIRSPKEFVRKVLAIKKPDADDVHASRPNPPPRMWKYPVAWFMSLVGVFGSICLLTYLTRNTSLDFLGISFGASVVLFFAAPNAPLSQPYNAIGGQLIASVVGCIGRLIIPDEIDYVRSAVAVTLSIGLMQLTRTTHPPAGATALYMSVAPITSLDTRWDKFIFILFPAGVGNLILIGFALVVNNLGRRSHYPDYWIPPKD